MAPLIFLLALVAWVVVCAPALIYAAIIEGRRRRDVAALDKKMAAVQHNFELLERRLQSVTSASAATVHAVAPVPSPASHVFHPHPRPPPPTPQPHIPAD